MRGRLKGCYRPRWITSSSIDLLHTFTDYAKTEFNYFFFFEYLSSQHRLSSVYLPFPQQLKGCFQQFFYFLYLQSVVLLFVAVVVCLFVWCCFFIRVNIYSRPRRLSHCRNEALAKIKESAAARWEEGRSHRPRALSIFLLFLFLLGHPAGASAGE